MRTRNGIVALLILAGSAAAAPTFSVQGVNRAEFWAFRDSLMTSLEDKLDLNLKYGDLHGVLGLFMFEPSKPWLGLRQPTRLLDYTIAYSPKRFEVLYGKYFQTFGKGLALNTFNDDDFRHYKSLKGLRATAHLPLRTDLVLLQGQMRDLFFQENTYKILNLADTSDQVLGADLSTRPFRDFIRAPEFARDFELGGRYVRINRGTDLTPKAFTELFGGDASAKVGPFQAYGEACWRQGTKPLVGGRDKGLGYYLNLVASIAGVSLLGEYMDYNKLAVPSDITPGNLALYRYNEPPTPILSGGSVNQGADERGFGINASATPIGPLYLEADFGRLYTHDDTTAGVVEWQGKARYSVSTSWTFEGKFDHLQQKNVELGTAQRIMNDPTVHVNYVVGNHTFALEADHNFVTEEPSDSIGTFWKYRETGVTLSYGYGANLLFTVGWQGVDRKLHKRYADQTSWPIFETVWSITDRNVLRVRVGSEKGGYTCSGGVCRFETPFTGVKVQLISKF
jgi:hypothetical protein